MQRNTLLLTVICTLGALACADEVEHFNPFEYSGTGGLEDAETGTETGGGEAQDGEAEAEEADDGEAGEGGEPGEDEDEDEEEEEEDDD
jgi:hypothetical protein